MRHSCAVCSAHQPEITCANCLAVRYCSVECLATHSAAHIVACGALTAASGRRPQPRAESGLSQLTNRHTAVAARAVDAADVWRRREGRRGRCKLARNRANVRRRTRGGDDVKATLLAARLLFIAQRFSCQYSRHSLRGGARGYVRWDSIPLGHPNFETEEPCVVLKVVEVGGVRKV
jgi:hypothetical protein